MFSFSSLLPSSLKRLKSPNTGKGTCRVRWHLSPLSLIHPGLGRGWDNHTLSPTTRPAQPCCSSCGRRCLYSPQGREAPSAPPEQSPVSPSTHQRSRHTKHGVRLYCLALDTVAWSFLSQDNLGDPSCSSLPAGMGNVSPQCHYYGINFNVSTSLQRSVLSSKMKGLQILP